VSDSQAPLAPRASVDPLDAAYADVVAAYSALAAYIPPDPLARAEELTRHDPDRGKDALQSLAYLYVPLAEQAQLKSAIFAYRRVYAGRVS
jgi:hypothetical protein